MGSGEVDDGGESDVGFSGLDHLSDFGGDGADEGGVFQGVEALDEGGGVEVGDCGDVHGDGSCGRFGAIDWGIIGCQGSWAGVIVGFVGEKSPYKPQVWWSGA